MKAKEVLDALLPYVVAFTIGGFVGLGTLFTW
jgi:hypothetical protein